MRNKLWIVLAGLVVVGSLFGGYQQYTQRQRLENLLNSRYQQAFLNLLEHVEQNQVLLAKILLTSSPKQRTALLSDVWYEANAAQENLNQLPISQPILGHTAKFLTQVGDYSYSLLRQFDLGKPLTDRQLDQITSLHNQMLALTKKLQAIRSQVTDGKVSWVEIKEHGKDKLPKGEIPLGEKTFRDIDQEIMQDQPVLIYDGPFSDHLEMVQPKGLAEKNVSPDEAKSILYDFLDISPEDKNWKMRTNAQSNPGGKIPAYSLKLEATNGKAEIIADVSKKGGHIVWMAINRPFGKPKLKPETAREKAVDFMKKKGFFRVKTSFMKINQYTVTVVLVPLQDDVVLYPDQVKVEVALDNGQVVGYEALGFLMAHHKRELPEPKVTRDEARKLVNEKFKVQAVNLAVIPLRSGKEVLAWELRGAYGGDTFFIYINALNGNEEQIFQIITNDNGQLAL